MTWASHCGLRDSQNTLPRALAAPGSAQGAEMQAGGAASVLCSVPGICTLGCIRVLRPPWKIVTGWAAKNNTDLLSYSPGSQKLEMSLTGAIRRCCQGWLLLVALGAGKNLLSRLFQLPEAVLLPWLVVLQHTALSCLDAIVPWPSAVSNLL